MTSPLVLAKTFHSFKDLASAYRENEDYVITCQTPVASSTAIVAPHGGGIETGTSELARAIAATDFSLYLFEGIRPKDNFRALHLTSHCFDEPQCLAMLGGCDDVITVHGCAVEGEAVLVGGLDRPMLLALARSVGGISNPGDEIDLLQGKWLEQTLAERMSVTPILKGSAAEVWDIDRRKLAHCHIYDAISSVKNLDVGDAASLLYQAYMGQDESRLMHCAQVLETIVESSVSNAVFQQLVWLPYVATSPGQRIYDKHPYVSILLRKLQFSVSNAVNSDSLVDVIRCWGEEISEVSDEDARNALEVLRCSTLLSNQNARVPLRMKLQAIVSMSKIGGEAGRTSEELLRKVIEKSRGAIGDVPEPISSTQFFLSMQASSVRGPVEFSAVLDWLEHDADEDARLAFERVLHWPIVTMCGAFVHGAWSAGHAEVTDWTPVLQLLHRADGVARRFSLVQFGGEVARATSIVHGEHLNDFASAMQVLDDAILAFGETSTIAEQKVNTLFQMKDYSRALEAWEVLIANGDTAKSIDAFAYRRAAICACHLGRWAQAERLFLEGSRLSPELTLPITKFGLVIDACYVAALASEPQRAARMLSTQFLNLPSPLWEDGHDDWEAVCKIASAVCGFIEAVAGGEDVAKFTLVYGKGSEPGLSFGASEPHQQLRTQLAIAQIGLVASRLGGIPSEYRALLEHVSKSHFPLVRRVAAEARLAFEFDAGPGDNFVYIVASFERAANRVAALPDLASRIQDDGGASEPSLRAMDNQGLVAIFAAAAMSCRHPEKVVAVWQKDTAALWGPDSAVASDLSDLARGLAFSIDEAKKRIREVDKRTVGETVGAALTLLRNERQTPLSTLRLQELLASATTFCNEGRLLQPNFGRAIARYFSMEWVAFSESPFLFSNPLVSVAALQEAISSVQQGRAAMGRLLRVAAQCVGVDNGEATSSLE